MPSSIRRIAARVGFFAALAQLFATACDPTAPNGPNDQKSLIPQASLMASGSTLTAKPVSWNEIDLTWPSSPSVSGYHVLRSTTGAAGPYIVIAATFPNVGSYADKGVTGSTQYCYEVRSFKTAGKNTSYGAFSSAACATTLPTPINAPSEIVAVPQGSRILVKWKDNSDNEDGFSIYGVYVASSAHVSVPANTTSAYINYVLTEQQGCFRVTAFNAVASMTSATDCTTVPAPAADLSATANAQTIALTWSDRSAFEDGYKVSRSAQNGLWTDIATLPANAASYTDVAVSADIYYTYRVQALKDGGYSDVSNEASGIIPTSLPAAPHDAYATYSLAGDTRMFYLGIAWVDASSNEAGFQIEFSPDGETDWSWYASASANGTSFFHLYGIEDFSPSGCFRVTAFNALGGSAPSNITCADPTGIIQQIVNTSAARIGGGAGTHSTRVKAGRRRISH
jgi:hypothetical protein